MIGPMTTAPPQQRFDRRLRELVQRTGDPSIAADLGLPRSATQTNLHHVTCADCRSGKDPPQDWAA